MATTKRVAIRILVNHIKQRNWWQIDWNGFGRTKGGFFDFLGMPMDPTPSDPRTTITASGGWCAPARQTGHTIDRYGFTKWRSWYPPLPPFELPRFSAPRGPIKWPQPNEDLPALPATKPRQPGAY